MTNDEWLYNLCRIQHEKCSKYSDKHLKTELRMLQRELNALERNEANKFIIRAQQTMIAIVEQYTKKATI